MRVISGKYRGLKLAEFAGRDIRPTADRVKESLFNILADKIAGAKVLDLFCGSGSLGIECLSRGAAEVHFNDISAESLSVLKKNLARLSGAVNAKITNCGFKAYLDGAQPFDLIFIDPPYRTEYGLEALSIIGNKRLLKSGGVAVYERDRSFTADVEGLRLYDERKYGKTFLGFFMESNDI